MTKIHCYSMLLFACVVRLIQYATARDSVHNYYENLVIEQLLRANDRATQDAEFLADVTCVALNRLPPRYIRHDVDMTFFLSPQELDEINDKVARAVNDAVDYVMSRERPAAPPAEPPIEKPAEPSEDEREVG